TDRGSSSVEPERGSSSLETECGSSSSSVKPKCGSSSSLEVERDDSECEIISTGKNHKSLNVLTDHNCISVIDEGTEKRCATSARSAHHTKYLSEWEKKSKYIKCANGCKREVSETDPRQNEAIQCCD
ncbi:unnamed protein product, partial [Rotaria sordida]